MKHNRYIFRAALAIVCTSLLTAGVSAADTRVAAVSKSSLPPISKDARKLPIDVNAAHIDYRGDTVVFKDVVITQGETRVSADHAHATGVENFENSHWTFEGNVKINGEQQGSLHSDLAVVEFRNKDIAKATVTGAPAEFEQKRADTNEMARGHAKQIVYDLVDGTVRLSNDAWVTDGHNQFSGDKLTYSIREQRLQGESQPGTDHRVHLTIDPQADSSKKNP
jgi:lipopolysaccharide transport protein LptA